MWFSHSTNSKFNSSRWTNNFLPTLPSSPDSFEHPTTMSSQLHISSSLFHIPLRFIRPKTKTSRRSAMLASTRFKALHSPRRLRPFINQPAKVWVSLTRLATPYCFLCTLLLPPSNSTNTTVSLLALASFFIPRKYTGSLNYSNACRHIFRLYHVSRTFWNISKLH